MSTSARERPEPSGQEHHNPETEQDTASGGPAETPRDDEDDDDIRIEDRPGRSRYVLTLGEREAGFAEYVRQPGRTTFTHTVVDPEFEGRGLGSRLVRFVVEEAIARGDHVVPVCPFTRAWLRKHPEYASRVEEPVLPRD